MFNRYGRGMSIGRRDAGSGFGDYVPPWPYVGRGRGGMPRCAYPGDLWRREARYWHGAPPVAEEEVEALRSQAEALKERLTEIERRIHDLERKEGA